MNKVDSARARLAEINSDIRITTYNESLTENNINELFSNYDIVVDGCDNFQTRYLINDACVKHRIPNVHGAVYRFDGYVTVLTAARQARVIAVYIPNPHHQSWRHPVWKPVCSASFLELSAYCRQ